MVNEIISSLKQSEGTLITFHNRKRIAVGFPKIYEMVENAAGHLSGHGLTDSSIIGIIGKNDMDYVIADLAAVFCGIKLLPLDLESDLDLFIQGDLNFDAIIICKEYSDKINQISARGIKCITLDSLQTKPDAHSAVTIHCYKDEEVFAYKTTSGSTGIPKVMGHSVMSVDNSINGVQEILKHAKDERVLVFLPLNLLQQRYWLYSAIVFGFTVIVVPKTFVFRAIKLERPTVIMGVPYIYEFLYSEFMKLIKTDADLKTDYDNYLKDGGVYFGPFGHYLGGAINYLWTGSAPIDPELVKFYFKMGVPLYQGYGMNETCIIAKNYKDNNKIGSVGKVFPNVEISFDEHQQILVKNKYPVCASYLLSSDQDLWTFCNDGYVHTGDVGFLDEDGYLFINGRIKEMIVLSNSKKIFPRHIEEKIQGHNSIKNCILYGDKKPYLTALIVPETSDTGNDAVRDIIKTYNASAKPEDQIYKFFIVTDMTDAMFTGLHKIRRKQVHEQYIAQFNKLYEQ